MQPKEWSSEEIPSLITVLHILICETKKQICIPQKNGHFNALLLTYKYNYKLMLLYFFLSVALFFCFLSIEKKILWSQFVAFIAAKYCLKYERSEAHPNFFWHCFSKHGPNFAMTQVKFKTYWCWTKNKASSKSLHNVTIHEIDMKLDSEGIGKKDTTIAKVSRNWQRPS